MKTGSTYIQVTLRNRADVLREFGISFGHIRPKNHNTFSLYKEYAEHSAKNNMQCAILSSELLSFKDTQLPIQAFRNICSEMHALMFYRPLADVYPSIYLQRLRGPRAETRSFEEFAEAQMAHDEKPSGKGPTFSYNVLENRMKHKGLGVVWRGYSKKHLIGNFLSMVPLETPKESELVLPPEQIDEQITNHPLSPLRSVPYGYAHEAIEINAAFRSKKINNNQRRNKIAKLLSQPDKGDARPPQELLERIARFDSRINGEFYESQSVGNVSPRG